MELIGLVIFYIGVFVGVVNWPIFISRKIKKSGPSIIPLVGTILMFIGALIQPSEQLKEYLWLIPIIDITGLPLLFFVICQALLRKVCGGRA
ncbi:TPA: hypothetical protein ACX3DU_004584 [Vibrio parahaemolyticus]